MSAALDASTAFDVLGASSTGLGLRISDVLNASSAVDARRGSVLSKVFFRAGVLPRSALETEAESRISDDPGLCKELILQVFILHDFFEGSPER